MPPIVDFESMLRLTRSAGEVRAPGAANQIADAHVASSVVMFITPIAYGPLLPVSLPPPMIGTSWPSTRPMRRL